jgi:hypothetical protein
MLFECTRTLAWPRGGADCRIGLNAKATWLPIGCPGPCPERSNSDLRQLALTRMNTGHLRCLSCKWGSSKPVGPGSPRLGRFDSFAASWPEMRALSDPLPGHCRSITVAGHSQSIPSSELPLRGQRRRGSRSHENGDEHARDSDYQRGPRGRGDRDGRDPDGVGDPYPAPRRPRAGSDRPRHAAPTGSSAAPPHPAAKHPSIAGRRSGMTNIKLHTMGPGATSP